MFLKTKGRKICEKNSLKKKKKEEMGSQVDVHYDCRFDTDPNNFQSEGSLLRSIDTDGKISLLLYNKYFYDDYRSVCIF